MHLRKYMTWPCVLISLKSSIILFYHTGYCKFLIAMLLVKMIIGFFLISYSFLLPLFLLLVASKIQYFQFNVLYTLIIYRMNFEFFLFRSRKEMSSYYLEHASVHHIQKHFDFFEEEARSLLALGLAIPAYVLELSSLIHCLGFLI